MLVYGVLIRRRTPLRGAWMETEKTLASVAEHLTSNTEDIGHGTESVEEVSDGGRVQQSDAGGKDAGEVLGGVPAGDVRREEGGRNAVQEPVGERQPNLRNAGTDGVAGDAGVGSAGVRERGTVQPAAGEVSGRENNHAEKAHDAGGSRAGDAGSVDDLDAEFDELDDMLEDFDDDEEDDEDEDLFDFSFFDIP